MQSLQEFFVDQVRDIYDAERQLVKSLPKMAKAAENEELADTIREHLEITQGQVERIEKIFQMLGVPAKGKPCKGMRGLIEEGSEIPQDEEDGAIRDLAIIAAAQKVEHYEISAYGTARTIAEQIGNTQAARLLQQSEDEEKDADAKLTEVASSLYGAADMEDVESEEEEEASGMATPRARARKPPQSGGKAAQPNVRRR